MKKAFSFVLILLLSSKGQSATLPLSKIEKQLYRLKNKCRTEVFKTALMSFSKDLGNFHSEASIQFEDLSTFTQIKAEISDAAIQTKEQETPECLLEQTKLWAALGDYFVALSEKYHADQSKKKVSPPPALPLTPATTESQSPSDPPRSVLDELIWNLRSREMDAKHFHWAYDTWPKGSEKIPSSRDLADKIFDWLTTEQLSQPQSNERLLNLMHFRATLLENKKNPEAPFEHVKDFFLSTAQLEEFLKQDPPKNDAQLYFSGTSPLEVYNLAYKETSEKLAKLGIRPNEIFENYKNIIDRTPLNLMDQNEQWDHLTHFRSQQKCREIGQPHSGPHLAKALREVEAEFEDPKTKTICKATALKEFALAQVREVLQTKVLGWKISSPHKMDREQKENRWLLWNTRNVRQFCPESRAEWIQKELPYEFFGEKLPNGQRMVKEFGFQKEKNDQLLAQLHQELFSENCRNALLGYMEAFESITGYSIRRFPPNSLSAEIFTGETCNAFALDKVPGGQQTINTIAYLERHASASDQKNIRFYLVGPERRIGCREFFKRYLPGKTAEERISQFMRKLNLGAHEEMSETSRESHSQ